MLGILIALFVPFTGTILGASFVLFTKNGMGEKSTKALLGFAAGVMIAASVWSLLIPGIELAESRGEIGWIPAAVGFLAGIGFLLLIDHFLPHQHLSSEEPEGIKAPLKKPTMLTFAVALHNLPEGMAVGVVLTGFLSGDAGISLSALIALACGIAIQNIPEGAIISGPLATYLSKRKAFLAGVGSGAIEPLGVGLMLAATGIMTPLLPYVLAFAAGAMIYVVVEELIPETQSGKHTNIGTIGVAIGFTLMMILDVALG